MSTNRMRRILGGPKGSNRWPRYKNGWREFLPWLQRGQTTMFGNYAIWHAPKWLSRLTGHGEEGLEIWRSKSIRPSKEHMRSAEAARRRREIYKSEGAAGGVKS